MIRPYLQSDKETVLTLLTQNTPTFFAISEFADLENYLDNEIDSYYIFEENGQILGAGGINYFHAENKGRLSWDMVSPIAQGKGIGKLLTEYRIAQIKEHQNIHYIEVRTSQHVYLFYKKMNFQLKHFIKNYWAVNFDLYLMELQLE